MENLAPYVSGVCGIVVVWLACILMKITSDRKHATVLIAKLEEVLSPVTQERFEQEMRTRTSNFIFETWMIADVQLRHAAWQKEQLPKLRRLLSEVEIYKKVLGKNQKKQLGAFRLQISKLEP